MSQYVLRRLLIAVPSLLGISLVLFIVLALAPGDPFSELATNPNVPPEVAAALRAKFGLDDPIYLRYLHWLTAMLHGDWGFSFVSRMNVDTLILQRLPATLYVIGSAQLLALTIAIPVGVYAATRPYSIFDQVANTLAFIGLSLPTFFTGLLFILIFSITLDWLPFVYTTDIKATGFRWVVEQIRQAIMPVMVLGLFQAASMTRFVRSAMLDVIRLDYVTTARAKGLGLAGGLQGLWPPQARRGQCGPAARPDRGRGVRPLRLARQHQRHRFQRAPRRPLAHPSLRHRRSRTGYSRPHDLWRTHLARGGL